MNKIRARSHFSARLDSSSRPLYKQPRRQDGGKPKNGVGTAVARIDGEASLLRDWAR